MLRFFLAGIMQGSHLGAVLHNQDYRARLKQLVVAGFPGADVYDPLADHSGSLDYDDATARIVFSRHNRLCREVDVVIAFVPEASMGTAIEMWEAFRHGRVVIAISPLVHNWAVKFLSHRLYLSVDDFAADLASGRLAAAIDEIRSGPLPSESRVD